MRKAILVTATLALAVTCLVSTDAYARQAEVRLAPVGRSYAPPPLGRKEGWLAISNRDWQDYDIVVGRKGKLFVYPAGQGGGGIRVRSGTTMSIALEKETWDIYGSNSDKLKVKIREGRTSSLMLEPFGYVGNTGLRGVTNDGDKVRSEVLIDSYAPPVVIQQPPVVVQQPPQVIVQKPPVVVQQPPQVVVQNPPPPVIVHRPPVIVQHPRPAPPPPPRRPSPHRRRDGWGFSFDFNM